jgi:hypothetical protein
MRRTGLLALGLLLVVRPAAAAEKQIRPLVGAALDGTTTFVDLENATRGPNGVLGFAAVLLGEVVGIEGDVGWSPGFFQKGNQHLVLHSGVTTVTGSLVVAMPRRLTEYTLRPYLVAGAGVMHVQIDDYFGILRVREDLPALALGGGAIGFITNRVGVAWDVRRLGSLKGSTGGTGVTIGGAGRISFWRASMALAFRYGR